MIEKIYLNENNRMLRRGFGKNEGRWFGRMDLWSVGYRFTGWHLIHYAFLQGLYNLAFLTLYGAPFWIILLLMVK